MTSPLLKAKAVSIRLGGISEAMVYQLAKTGKLPCVKFQAWPGKRSTIRFTEGAVQAFIAEHTAKEPGR